MTPPLFLLDDLGDGNELHLGGDEGRHAARVKRLGVGESLLVSDGRGALVSASVAAVVGDGLRIRVVSRSQVPRRDPLIVVVQALPKGERAELAVEVLTELGVDEIVPWAAARSIAQWHGQRGERALEKWRRTAREAAKQSRRAWVPDIAALASTTDVGARVASADAALVLHEDAATTMSAAPLPPGGEIVVIVGPEGGISAAELEAFVAAGGRLVRLGDTVLRTSTAGPAAVSALSLRLGRWG